MKSEKIFSSLNILLDNVEGTNLLLEYLSEFSRRIFSSRDFKSILNNFYSELRKIYANQHIEFVLWHNHQRLVKFVFDERNGRVAPVEEFTEVNSLYNYVLEKQQPVLTNNYRQFCDSQGLTDCGIPASSWLGIPMTVRGKVQGMVVLWDENPERYFLLQDKQFLSVVTNVVSFAIENLSLYEYIVEKNGSYKIFETVLPKGIYRNSTKSIINHLLTAVLGLHDVQYTGIFLRSQYYDRWRVLSEKYEGKEFSHLGLELMKHLPQLKDEQLNSQDYLYWHEQYLSHPLNSILQDTAKKFRLNAAMLFPFAIGQSYYGVWVIGFRRDEEEVSNEEMQLFQFVFYLLVQLIEKKALIERKNKYEAYMKHLEKMKLAGELASGSAHHLNNILSVILAKTQLLQRKLKDPRFQKDLQTIEQVALDGAQAVRRLQSLTNVREDASESTLIDLNKLVQEVVEIARPRFEREAQFKGIVYDLKLSLGKIYPVKGDSAGLREVLLNLVNNALDAMPKGGQLSIQTTLKDNDVLIFISDTGVGIPENIRERIFEPFFTTKGEKGNGLGLSIAAEIISRHRGKIYVDSIPNKGSIFMIELPAVMDKDLPSLEPAPAADQFAFKVLLVDDEGVVRETLAEMLEDEGCEVTMAKNAEDAVLKFQKYQCDLVLTDLSMPGVNGYELARRIKEINPNVPVFLITGWNQLDRKFLESNRVIDGIIEKPFNMKQIKQHITKFWQKKGNLQRLPSLD